MCWNQIFWSPDWGLTVIQELWFQFLCINPSSEQPWSFFHLITRQNSDWLNSIGAVLRNGQASPAHSEHDKPQQRGGPRRSWGRRQGQARESAPPRGPTNSEAKSHPRSKQQSARHSPLTCLAYGSIRYLSLIPSHLYNNFTTTIPNY